MHIFPALTAAGLRREGLPSANKFFAGNGLLHTAHGINLTSTAADFGGVRSGRRFHRRRAAAEDAERAYSTSECFCMLWRSPADFVGARYHPRQNADPVREDHQTLVLPSWLAGIFGLR